MSSSEIPERLRERFDYPELDNHAKLRILGFNSAKLYGIRIEDGQASANSDDRLTKLRNNYQVFQEDEGPARSNAAYGWIRART